MAKKANKLWLTVGAILVVIVIALLVLASTGFFSSYSVNAGSCFVTSANFGCSNSNLYNGTFTATIYQKTGTMWAQSNFFFVIAGSSPPTSVPPLPCEEGISTPITSGQAVNISLNSYSNSNTCAGMPNTVGQSLSGTLWAGYSTTQNGTEQFAQIATFALKAK